MSFQSFSYFAFLPAAAFLYLKVCPARFQNGLLLAASALFYWANRPTGADWPAAWPLVPLAVLAAVCLFVWRAALALARREKAQRGRLLAAAVVALLAVLGGGFLLKHAETVTDFDVWLFYFLSELALLSIGLGIFNLIPIPPLDGSKVLFAFLPDRAYMTLMRYERYGFLALLVIMYLDVGSRFLTRAIVAVYQFFWNLVL